jgi:hypothetical protein
MPRCHSRRAHRARSGIQKSRSFANLLWIPDQAFGLSGMTLDSAIPTRTLMLRRRRRRRLEACAAARPLLRIENASELLVSFPTRASRAIGNPEKLIIREFALDSRSGLRPVGNDTGERHSNSRPHAEEAPKAPSRSMRTSLRQHIDRRTGLTKGAPISYFARLPCGLGATDLRYMRFLS